LAIDGTSALLLATIKPAAGAMANIQQADLLKQGSEVWNAWRRGINFSPDLSGAVLDGAVLNGADLRGVDLTSASLVQTHLKHADLSDARLGGRASLVEASLNGANLSGALLSGTDFVAANLTGANLCGAGLDAADLSWSRLLGADLRDTDLTLTRFRSAEMAGANLTNAVLDGTLLANVDLKDVIGLDSCEHFGPSIIDQLSLQMSGSLPVSFLRGVGLPEALIDLLPSIFNHSPIYYTCFISYSHKDEAFAKRLYSDLQQVGVRCWFAPHDMPIGGKILDEVHDAISRRDRLLLILSEHSIKSEWVEDEVTKAFDEERRRDAKIIFPVRLDDSIMQSSEPWAEKLRVRHICDFRRWRARKYYEQSFEQIRSNLSQREK
jgi:hypothetical protein